MKNKEREKVEFRYYEIPQGKTLIALQGKRWEIIYGTDPMHFHNYLEIGYCYYGKGKMNLAGEEVSYADGTVTVVPKKFPHHTVAKDEKLQKWGYLFIDSESLLKKMFPERSRAADEAIRRLDSSMLVIPEKENPEIGFLVKMILEEMRIKRELYQETVDAELTALLLKIIRMNPVHEVTDVRMENSRNFGDILNALEFIEQHYQEEIHISQIVNVSHMSETHFRRKFNEYMHISPSEYVNLVRIKKACEILEKSEDNIADIAIRVGFQTTGAFVRNFKKLVGEVPREWRKSAREGINNPVNYNISVLKGW